MRRRRVLALYAAFLCAFAVLLCRLFWLCSNRVYAARAAAQSTVRLALPARRGDFYDCKGRLLTGMGCRWLALCLPGQGSYTRLYTLAETAGQVQLYQKRNAARPFLLDVGQDVSVLGVRSYAVPRRYGDAPLAAALLGYLDRAGHGVAGLEAAFDAQLSGSGAHDTLVCTVTAQGTLQAGTEPVLSPADSGAVGIQLTLSRPIQRAVEAAVSQTMETGCVVVLDTAAAKVRACVSLPGFDPENVAASLDAPNSPLLNRAFSTYAVGSVFKPVLAAAALEAGLAGFVYDCPGYCMVDGQVFRCAGGVPHGQVDLAGALQKSCNGYFIRLGRQLGPRQVREMAARLGFGKALSLTDSLCTAAGQLPEESTLASSGAFANFCFGQGELLATPLQIAGMMNALACGGVFREPLLLEATLDETTGEPLQTLSHRWSRRVVSQTAAQTLQALLVSVVREGTGRDAAPEEGTAGGKTGTAQTGQFAGGEERKNFWFAGFWPGERPRYTIIVLQDGQTAPAHSSAAVFAAVCAALKTAGD